MNLIYEMIKETEGSVESLKAGFLIEVAEAIFSVLEANGMTQSDLAKKMGKSRAWVSRVLQCKENLTVETMVRIGRALDFEWNVKPLIALPPLKNTCEEGLK